MRLYKVERFRNASGFLLGVFFIMVFTARFFIEFVKENQVAFEDSMSLNMGQLLSVPVVLAGVFLVLRALKNSRPDKLAEQTEIR
jgi:phosphatidylglycerol---prolipoprotein diacylglyceryl transferase